MEELNDLSRPNPPEAQKEGKEEGDQELYQKLTRSSLPRPRHDPLVPFLPSQLQQSP